jgi:site-specific DNA-methyltransferase (adenine-specific)
MIVIQDNLAYCRTVNDNSIDLIYFNPPFGTTEQEWDKSLQWEELFPEMDRILKPTGNIVIHSAIPFTYDLIRHRKPKYHWVWDKGTTGSPFLAKKQPMRDTEEILVYFKTGGTGCYYPQMNGDKERVITGSKKTTYWGGRGGTQNEYVTVVKGKYPKHLLHFKRKREGLSTRPPELIEYIVTTYTKEGETVLDLTCYKGLTGTVCDKIGRKYIGVDIKDWNAPLTLTPQGEPYVPRDGDPQ